MGTSKRAELRVIADVGQLDPGADDHVDEALSGVPVVGKTINQNRHLRDRQSEKWILVALPKVLKLIVRLA
jgi:hypothetical protein